MKRFLSTTVACLLLLMSLAGCAKTPPLASSVASPAGSQGSSSVAPSALREGMQKYSNEALQIMRNELAAAKLTAKDEESLLKNIAPIVGIGMVADQLDELDMNDILNKKDDLKDMKETLEKCKKELDSATFTEPLAHIKTLLNESVDVLIPGVELCIAAGNDADAVAAKSEIKQRLGIVEQYFDVMESMEDFDDID